MAWLSAEEIEEYRVVARVAILYHLATNEGREDVVVEGSTLTDECLDAIIAAKKGNEDESAQTLIDTYHLARFV